MSKEIRAKWAGTCAKCNGIIHKGDTLILSEEMETSNGQRGRFWIHKECPTSEEKVTFIKADEPKYESAILRDHEHRIRRIEEWIRDFSRPQRGA